MPDITMCYGKECLLKATCHRAQAVPSEYRQAYFYEPPFKEKLTGHSCEHYWITRQGRGVDDNGLHKET